MKVFENFYVKGPVEVLQAPLPLEPFMKLDENGKPLDPVEYKTILEYLADKNQTIKRYSNDGKWFLKGFGFNVKTLMSLLSQLSTFGLEDGKNIFIMTINEKDEELEKDMWKKEEIL